VFSLKEAVVKKLIGVALLGLVVITARAQAAGPIVGYISDDKCALSGAKSAKAAEWIKPAAFESCVKDCLKQGSEAVFVTDAASFVTNPDKNPTLTIMALSWRASEYLIDQAKKGSL